jgi:threonyl-tRNA synthetase
MATSNQQDSYTTPEGYRNYKRTIAFILAAAAQRLNLGNLAVEESIGASFVFIVKNSETSTETANGLQEAMKALVSEDIAIVSEEVPRAELVAYFTKLGADRSLAFVSAQPSTHMQCNSLALGNSEMKYIGIAHHKLVRSTGAVDPQHFLVSAETKPFRTTDCIMRSSLTISWCWTRLSTNEMKVPCCKLMPLAKNGAESCT